MSLGNLRNLRLYSTSVYFLVNSLACLLCLERSRPTMNLNLGVTTLLVRRLLHAFLHRLILKGWEGSDPIYSRLGGLKSVSASLFSGRCSRRQPSHIPQQERSSRLQEYFISGFTIILPTLSTALDIPPESRTWPANVFSLVTGAFLLPFALPFARLAEMYSAYTVFTSGLIWLCVWSLIAGFSQNFLMLTFCRALQGFGPTAFLPAGIMLLGSIYRPGPRKNLVFCLYGTFSRIGFSRAYL
jgi:hypothetical protein